MTNEELLLFNKKRKIVQICYVTRDYKKTIKNWLDYLKVGPWVILSLSDKTTRNVKIDGKLVKEPFEFIVAFSYIGDMQIEVIQPVRGPSAYTKFIDQKGEGIHHIKEKVDDVILKKVLDDYKKKKIDVCFSGQFDIDLFYYLDLESIIGSIYELGNSPVLNLSKDMFSIYPEK